MSFISGLILIDAPASALNNLGKIEGMMTDNASGVKFIKTREGAYPYVSAQSFRYWLRETLKRGDFGWQAAPIYREEKIAYTDANPILWWDDDLFGYMRAPSKKETAAKARAADKTRATETPTAETVTRVSPFRVSTLVSIGPVSLVNDFGVMSRHEGDPVPYEHQFYKTTLHGLFSLDLRWAGSFSYRDKTGFLNLDEPRKKLADEKGLQKIEEEKVYRLPAADRIQRISSLLKGFARVDGGAKQAQHYTDVSPDIIFSAVVKGGNNIFGHIVGPDKNGKPHLKIEALKQSLDVHGADILSKVYVGWVEGYLDEEKAAFLAAFGDSGPLNAFKDRLIINHPLRALEGLVSELRANSSWLE